MSFPDGRRQALGTAWDSRPADRGGQRWFHLYPGETIRAGDPLHWTGFLQNWNFMCADCHSTNLRKGYDREARTYQTTWSEISVGCESCHGPASRHVAQMQGPVTSRDEARGFTTRLDERKAVTWVPDAATGRPTRSQPRGSDREIDTCARCHARRTQLTDEVTPGDAFAQAFRASLLEPTLFHPDGQQDDEVYTYASFLQSRMYAKGVTCSDCHNPHSGALRLPGNATCTQCHQAPQYDATSHHGHRANTPAAQCATCHMPTKTYMQIDPRHDHSFRVPRPDLSAAIGVPNACTSACHANRDARWAARAIETRRQGGTDSRDDWMRFAGAFAALDRSAGPSQAREVVQVAADPAAPAIVRASALSRLARSGTGAPVPFDRLLGDPSPLVRRGALEVLRAADDNTRLRLAPALLGDAVRTVRAEAVLAVGDLADRALTGPARASFERAFTESVAEQHFNAERPEAQTNLGNLWLMRGRLEEAATAFREAIRIDRTFSAAHVNLSDVYRQQGLESRAEETLRAGVAASPSTAALRHALGLTLVRQRRTAEAISELREAARLDPSAARYSYVYGVALHDTGKAGDALRVLRAAAVRHQTDRDILLALGLYCRDAGLAAEARTYADRLLALDPADAAARDLRQSLGGR